MAPTNLSTAADTKEQKKQFSGLNIKEAEKWWIRLYQNELDTILDANSFLLPEKNPEFNIAVAIPKILTNRLAVEICSKYFTVNISSLIDLDLLANDRDPQTIGNYMVFFKDRSEPDAKYLGKDNLGKSNIVKAIQNRVVGCTFIERMMLELKYFLQYYKLSPKETKKAPGTKHLDKKFMTWCKGSTYNQRVTGSLIVGKGNSKKEIPTVRITTKGDEMIMVFWFSGEMWVLPFEYATSYEKVGIREICPPIIPVT